MNDSHNTPKIQNMFPLKRSTPFKTLLAQEQEVSSLFQQVSRPSPKSRPENARITVFRSAPLNGFRRVPAIRKLLPTCTSVTVTLTRDGRVGSYYYC